MISFLCRRIWRGDYALITRRRHRGTSLTDSHRTKGRRNVERVMQHLAEISREFVSPFALSPSRAFYGFPPLPSPFAYSFCLSFLRLPFRPVIPLPANYAVVVAICHVIKLHLFTMKRDCYQAFDSRAGLASTFPVSLRRSSSFHWLSTCRRDYVLVSVDLNITHVIFKSISNDLLKFYPRIKSLKFVNWEI